MNKHFKVEFISPDNIVTFDQVYLLSLCSTEGELAILPDHSPFTIYLLPSLVIVKTLEKKDEKIIIDDAVLEVANNYCNIMTSKLQKSDIDDGVKHKKKASLQQYFDYLLVAKENKDV